MANGGTRERGGATKVDRGAGRGSPGGATRTGTTRTGGTRNSATRTGGTRNRGAGSGAARRQPETRTEARPSVSPSLPRWRPMTALVLSLAGFGDSMYLTIEHFTGGSPICAANSVVDCLKVTTSPESELFGHIPVSLLGLVFFTAMVVINLPVMWRSPLRWIAWGRLAMVVGGMGFVLYLLYAELFEIKAICLWCTGVHVLTFLLFVLVVSSIQMVPGGWSDQSDQRTLSTA